MNLETQKTIVPKSAKDLFALLEKVETFERLMPENISKFEKLSDTSFVFALKGMPEIYLEKKSSTPHSQLVLGEANGKIPKTPISKFIEVLVTKIKDL